MFSMTFNHLRTWPFRGQGGSQEHTSFEPLPLRCCALAPLSLFITFARLNINGPWNRQDRKVSRLIQKEIGRHLSKKRGNEFAPLRKIISIIRVRGNSDLSLL